MNGQDLVVLERWREENCGTGFGTVAHEEFFLGGLLPEANVFVRGDYYGAVGPLICKFLLLCAEGLDVNNVYVP